MTTEDLIACSDEYVMKTYNRTPMVLVRGKGTRVWDSDGRQYLDFVAGIAVCSLGHSHPKVVEAIQRQAETLIHVSNLYYIEPQIGFAERLVNSAFDGQVFFCNSGAEANEGAIKLARKYAHEKMGEDKFELITMENSFHGRTHGHDHGYRADQVSARLRSPPERVQVCSVTITRRRSRRRSAKKTCGVLLEPIQGEGGIQVPAPDYLQKVRKICNDHGISDDPRRGPGRDGTDRDPFCLPGLRDRARYHDPGQGARERLSDGGDAGEAGGRCRLCSGQPRLDLRGQSPGMAAGLATLKAILEDGVLENCRRMGDYFVDKLKDAEREVPRHPGDQGQGPDDRRRADDRRRGDRHASAGRRDS